MVSRVKRMFRNEKGFTLVELLAVIVILGIIVAIAVPAIGSIIDKADGKADNAQDELVYDAARLADVAGDFEASVTTEWDLIENDYLEATGDFAELSDSNKGRTIYKDGGTYTFDNPSPTS